MNEMYLQFSLVDEDGQYLDPVAIIIKSVNWHGLTANETILLDIVHKDWTHERLHIQCKLYGEFKLPQSQERIIGIRVLPWAHPVLTKDEFHSRFGKGKFIHPSRNHFVNENELGK